MRIQCLACYHTCCFFFVQRGRARAARHTAFSMRDAAFHNDAKLVVACTGMLHHKHPERHALMLKIRSAVVHDWVSKMYHDDSLLTSRNASPQTP